MVDRFAPRCAGRINQGSALIRPSVTIVDYGGGNVRSLRAALERCGAVVETVTDSARIAQADRLMLAGQGAAGAAMAALADHGLDRALIDAAGRGIPILGVCVGLQILFDDSDEDDARCLGLIPGRVRLLQGVKRLPHLGWNDVDPIGQHALNDCLPLVAYFAHSFAVETTVASVIGITRVDDSSFASVVVHGNVAGAQFHPERSAEAGRTLLRSFLAWDGD